MCAIVVYSVSPATAHTKKCYAHAVMPNAIRKTKKSHSKQQWANDKSKQKDTLIILNIIHISVGTILYSFLRSTDTLV